MNNNNNNHIYKAHIQKTAILARKQKLSLKKILSLMLFVWQSTNTKTSIYLSKSLFPPFIRSILKEMSRDILSDNSLSNEP